MAQTLAPQGNLIIAANISSDDDDGHDDDDAGRMQATQGAATLQQLQMGA